MRLSHYEMFTTATDGAERRYMQAILMYELILILVVNSCIPSHFLAA